MADAHHSFLGEVSLNTVAMDAAPRRLHLYQSVAILNLVYMACGTGFAWSSPVLLKLELSDVEGSTVASMLSLGSVFGPFVSGAVLDRLGRKSTVALSMALMSTSYLILTLCSGYRLLATGRFAAGISCGIAFSAMPIYIAEISEDSVRGLLNTLSQISCCLGGLLVLGIGPFVSYDAFHYTLLCLCAVFFLLFPLLPKSPHSLVMKGDVEQAREMLTWLRENRSAVFVDKELESIQNTFHQTQEESSSVKELFTSVGNRRGMLICCGLLTLQQISGISIVFFYMEKIFLMTGTSISSSTCSIIIGLFMTVSAFICPFAVKYFGYKMPLLISCSGMAVGMAGLGVFCLLKFNQFDVASISWVPLLSLVLYILFFNSGFANIPWALSGELFPSNIRALATTLIAALCGFVAFLTTNLFPHLISLVGLDFLFISCSFFCCLTIVFIILLVEDTSGLSFDEIQEVLKGRKRKNLRLNQPV